uniref:Conserved oligomeric Golgi complex subunit 4 n=1 Tax=Angiostrongylus cantonensis TaxID=6313 RepID=A0A0K0CXD4_ANGCA
MMTYLKEPDEDDLYISKQLQELRVELDVKRREEERLQKEIADVLNECASGDQSRAFGMAVSRLNNAMLVVEGDSKQLASSLRTISRLADNISSKVSALDIAKTRVVECLQLAGDMYDLGVCSEGVDECISNEDYEQAAQHIHRFLTLDRAVFQFISLFIVAGQSVSHSYEVLANATTRLKGILERKLDAAIDNEDIAGIQRFVKLFPMINEHDKGLLQFGKYLSKKIIKIGDDNLKIMNVGGTDDKRVNVLYADTLFLFFEGTAALLETNQPIVENSYGPDKLLDFINILQVLERLLRDERHTKFFVVAERLDPLELDTLLSEICLMNTHTEMYWRFVRRRIKECLFRPSFPRQNSDEKVRRKEEREKKLDQLLNRSLVGSKMQELLGNYLLLEQYYMGESIRKAIDTDVKEEGLLSTVVDDVLFLVRKCVRRAMSSGSVDCVCAALNNGVALLETTFYRHLYNAIQVRRYEFITSALFRFLSEPAKPVPLRVWEIDTGLVRVKITLCSPVGKTSYCTVFQRSDIETGKLEHAVGQLTDVSRKMHHLASLGMESLFFIIEIEIIIFGQGNQLCRYNSLLLIVCSEVERQMERVIMKCSFNRLGGLQLDREFRQLSTYLSGIAGWTARERCARLAQIVALLNVENLEEAVELRDTTRASSIARVLLASDAVKVLQLRTDFPASLVQKLDL